MRFSFGKIWAAAVCLLVFASCAKDTSESYAGIEQRSLDAWMKLHRPELLGNRPVSYTHLTLPTKLEV